MDACSTVTFGLVSLVVVLWYIWRKRRMSYFERLGIPGPKPHLIMGNLNNSSEQAHLSLEWETKYGKVYGIYMGAWPFLVVSDVELLKIIQVKEFKTFLGRPEFLTDLAIAHPFAHEGVFAKSGEKWKNARSAITPAFTAGKLKQMMPILIEAINVFLEKIEATNQGVFDISPLFRKLSFDVNSRTAFGISTNIQHNDDNQFIRSVCRSFDTDTRDLLAKAIIYFPELHPLPKILRIIRDKMRSVIRLPSATTVFETCAQIIKIRRNNPEAVRQDLLQALIDASKEHSKDGVLEEKGVASYTPLTEPEVLANAFGFMLAGFEATSGMLSFCTHHLTELPEVQEKLREEINLKVKGEIDYETLHQLPYLDKVISETLRTFPFSVAGINRTALKEYKYKDMLIPKGMNIGIALHSLNMDPNYWMDPEVFNPERFHLPSADMNNIVYQPFGSGPRNCVGMRFAQFLMKTVMVCLLRKYRLQKPQGVKEFELEYTVFLIKPKHGVQVQAFPI